MGEENTILKRLISLFFFLFLVAAIIIAGYMLYQNIPGNIQNPISVEIDNSTATIKNFSYSIPQFYPNMKFNHNNISYKIDIMCDAPQKQRVYEAFEVISQRVGNIYFYETFDVNPDIDIACSEVRESIGDDGFFIAGEGGAKEIIQTGKYNVITGGIVILHEVSQKKCKWPNVEIHELLHVFGFNHSDSKESLMYPILEDCNQAIDNSVIDMLKKLYSEKNGPDLYFEKIDSIKRGRYLDFNLTVKNAGTLHSNPVSLAVLDGNQKVQDFELKAIPFGAGLSLEVVNLKLTSRSSKEVSFVIDPLNSLQEIDKTNNAAKITFN
ncbi:MAG: matrixin family metalloprotease [Candidatus Nanoarchaeia archaeon]